MAKGMKGTDVQVNFKPLGTQLRNVQCLICGVWGHSRGDRECSKSGWDPFSMKGPMVTASDANAKQPNKLIDESEAAAKDDKRCRDNLDSDSDDSYEDRRKEKKRRRKQKKKRRQRSPSVDSIDRSRTRDKYDRGRDRRKNHKKEEKKKRSRYDSDSD
jgi:CBF1 interacting corepressor